MCSGCIQCLSASNRLSYKIATAILQLDFSNVHLRLLVLLPLHLLKLGTSLGALRGGLDQCCNLHIV